MTINQMVKRVLFLGGKLHCNRKIARSEIVLSSMCLPIQMKLEMKFRMGLINL